MTRSSARTTKRQIDERTEAAWDHEWDKMFSATAERTPLGTIKARYSALMECFAGEVGVSAEERGGFASTR